MISSVSRETRLARFTEMVIVENRLQNLVSESTIPDFETRHIADAAQLVGLASAGARWCDIGSGAGLPGIVIAILTDEPVTLIEPRKLRAAFLVRVCEALALDKVDVQAIKAERVVGQFDIITARAVAETGALFAMASHLSHDGTRWILPKGRNAKKELAAAKQSWQGKFELVASRTSDDAMILVAEQVRRKGKR